MESLSTALLPYKDIVGLVASVVTIGQFFSGVFVCLDIYKKKSTAGTASTPFVGGIVVGSLMLKHGLLLNDPAMIQVNVVAIFLNIIYTAFFYHYSRDKQEDVLKPLGVGVAIIAVLLGYAQIEDPNHIEYRFGLIVTMLMLLLLASPLKDLKEIIAKKDASSIPFPLTFMAVIVTFLWFLYGIILMNSFMLVQNIIGFILSLVQLILIYLYPGRQEEQGKKKKKIVKRE